MTDKNRLAHLRSSLIHYNEVQITVMIRVMLEEYRNRWNLYTEQRDEFYKLFQKMENSNANYPFGYMTNYYFRNFERPTTVFYNGWSEFDEQNYHLLTDQEMVDLERRFKVEDITVEVQKSIQETRGYVDGVVAKNAPIRRLKGMKEFYSELIAIRDESWWYQKNLVSEMHPKQAVTREEAHSGMGLKMPFHRELYVKLHPAYTTFTILKTKLNRLKTVLDSISSDLAFSELKEDTTEELAVGQVEIPQDTAELANFLFDRMQFHPRVITASKSLFESGHYAQAIFEAFKAVENFVQDKSGLTIFGTNLMESVFNEENPIIKVPEAGHYYKEVQKGFKHLFVGASQGIRNPKAHKEIIQKDPYITLQYLGFFSFLLKRIDYWETGVS
jgi:uncharacterized protein (TIGR02391 family)